MSPSSELAARLEKMAVERESLGKRQRTNASFSLADGCPNIARIEGELAMAHEVVAADLRAAAQAVREREWRPIAEAPKDGTEILTWVGGVAEPFKYICRWSDSYSIHGLGGNWTDGLCNMGIEVTQWMPLPAPPEVGG